MTAESRENASKSFKVCTRINILLSVAVIALSVSLWKAREISVPANILTYDQSMDVKSLELMRKELDSRRAESVIAINKDKSGKLDSTLYSKNFLDDKTGSDPSFGELLLQIVSGSGNAYAEDGWQEGPCYVFVYEGKVFRYCP